MSVHETIQHIQETVFRVEGENGWKISPEARFLNMISWLKRKGKIQTEAIRIMEQKNPLPEYVWIIVRGDSRFTEADEDDFFKPYDTMEEAIKYVQRRNNQGFSKSWVCKVKTSVWQVDESDGLYVSKSDIVEWVGGPKPKQWDPYA